MKATRNHVYLCACGCGGQTSVLHEIVPGNGNRPVCVEYNIQVPLTHPCHRATHGEYTKHARSFLYSFLKNDGEGSRQILDQKAIAKHLCENYLKIDYEKTFRAVKNKEHRGYLEKVKKKCEKILLSRRIA